MVDNIVSTLTIKISGEQKPYTIEASTTFAKTELLSFNWLPTDDELRTLRLLEDELEDVSEESIISIGQSLYKSVFTPEILLLYNKAKQKAGSNNVRLRLIVSSSELNKLPWEIMHNGDDFISLYSQYPLVRGLRDVIQVRSAPVIGPVKVLYAWAEPKDKPEIHASVGGDSIIKLLGGNKLIKLDILPNASLIQLRKALLLEYHIVCFAGHGNEDGLVFEKFNGSELVTAKEFAREIEGRQVKLVFLAACKTGSESKDNLAGFAQTLAKQTPVPSIVAMQYEIGDNQANLLTTRFFELIANFRSIDVALADARKALLKDRKSLRDVFAPVIYLQGQTSNLFRRARNWLAISLSVFSAVLLIALLIFFIYTEVYRQELINSKSIETANQAMKAYTEGYPDLALALALSANQIENPPGHSQQSLYRIAYSPGSIEIFPADRGIFTPLKNEILLLRGTQIIRRNVLTNEETIYFETDQQIWDFDINPDGNFVAFLFENGQVGIASYPVIDKLNYFSFPDKYYEFEGEIIDPMSDLLNSLIGHFQDNIDDILVFDPYSNGIIVAYTDKFVYGDTSSMKSTCETSTKGINIVDVSWIYQSKVLLGLENGGLATVDLISCSVSEIFFWNKLYDGKAMTSEGLIDVRGINIRVDATREGTYYIGLPIFPTAFHALNEYYVLVLDSESKEVIRRFDGEEMYGVDGLAASRQGEILLAGDPNSIIAWNSEDFEQIYKFNLPFHLLTQIAINDDGSQALVSDTDGITRLLSLKSDFLLRAQYDFGYEGTGTLISDSQILPDGKSILIGGMSTVRSDPRTIHVNLEDGSLINTFEWHEGITGLALLGEKIALEASESGLWLINIEDPSLSKQILDTSIASLALSSDKKTIAVNSSSRIVLIDSITFEILSTIDNNTDSITTMAFSPNGARLAAGMPDKTIRIWDVKSSEEFLSLSGSADSITEVLFLSEDQLASADDRFVRIWDISSGRQVSLLDGFISVNDIEVGPSGETLISGSSDGKVLLWDIESGENIFSLDIGKPVSSISVYPENKLVVGTGDGFIQIWDVHLSLDALKEWINNNRYIQELTCDDRVKYSIEPLCE